MAVQSSNSPHTPRPAGRSLALAAALILGVIALIIGGGLLLTRLGPQPEATTAPTHVSEHPDDVVVTGPVVEVPPLTVTPLTFSAPEEANNLYLQFILDGSGSMMARLPDGTLRRDAAREVLIAHLRAFPPQAHIGLRAFGHRMPWSGQEEASCQDIEQIAPVETGQLERMALWLRDFEAQGMTPLAEAIRLAMGDFVNEPERVNTLIMISDGEETCGGDPCPLVAELKAQGIAFTLHVVGLDVAGDARAQLQCIAEAGGGLYRDADSAATLDRALVEIGHTVAAVTQAVVVTEAPPITMPTPMATPTPMPTATPTETPIPTPRPLIVIRPPARYRHTLAYDSSRGVVVLFGGFGNDYTRPTDTWEWDGVDWVERKPAISPPSWEKSAMVYDSVRSVCVLFGTPCLEDRFCEEDTWEWNGADWVARSSASYPWKRYAHAMAYDSARGITVLFGGDSSFTPDAPRLQDTWEWDGVNWMERSPAARPPGRDYHALAYDSIRGVTVLFGGGYNYFASDPPRLQDTWEWDGVNWTERNPVDRPPGRYAHAMAYDDARGVTVLFGGGYYLNDTWEWDGVNWVERNPSTRPPARNGHALAYDSARGVIVLFGGQNSTGFLDDTWEWDGATWVQR